MKLTKYIDLLIPLTLLALVLTAFTLTVKGNDKVSQGIIKTITK